MNEKNIIPLFTGDYADPTVIEFHGAFYMTHMKTSFPCALIWKSEDLLTWKPLCAAAPMFGHISAPELAVCGDTVYLFVTSGWVNFVLTSKDMLHWSLPVRLGVGTIDPGFVEDRQTGKRYLYFADGHAFELGSDGMPVADLGKLYDGWEFPEEWDTEGRLLLESPKLFYREPYYYMVSAEGGTGGPSTSHMCVVARSKSPVGPWENSPYNPLVHCDSDEEQWWTKGHGTAMEDHDGNWWVIYHAYEKGNHNLGRQTIMQPLKWLEDGWFVVDDSKDLTKVRPRHVELSDDFQGNTPGWQWGFMKPPCPKDVKVGDGELRLRAFGGRLEESNLCCMSPMDKEFTVEIAFDAAGGATATFTYCYPRRKNGWMYSGFEYSDGVLNVWIDMYQVRRAYPIDGKPAGLSLRIQKMGQNLRFFYSVDGERWTKLDCAVEASGYQHNVAGGYAAPRIMLGAMGSGAVAFRKFLYWGNNVN